MRRVFNIIVNYFIIVSMPLWFGTFVLIMFLLAAFGGDENARAYLIGVDNLFKDATRGGR